MAWMEEYWRLIPGYAAFIDSSQEVDGELVACGLRLRTMDEYFFFFLAWWEFQSKKNLMANVRKKRDAKLTFTARDASTCSAKPLVAGPKIAFHCGDWIESKSVTAGYFFISSRLSAPLNVHSETNVALRRSVQASAVYVPAERSMLFNSWFHHKQPNPATNELTIYRL